MGCRGPAQRHHCRAFPQDQASLPAVCSGQQEEAFRKLSLQVQGEPQPCTLQQAWHSSPALHPRDRSIPRLPEWLCWAWTDSPAPLQPHMAAQIPAHAASLAGKPWASAQDGSSAVGQPSPSHPARWWERPLTARALQAEQLTAVVGVRQCVHTRRVVKGWSLPQGW